MYKVIDIVSNVESTCTEIVIAVKRYGAFSDRGQSGVLIFGSRFLVTSKSYIRQ